MNRSSKKQVSMSRRLTLALVSVMTLIVVLVAGGFYFYTAAQLERNFERKIDETVSYLDGTIGQLLWHLDHNSVARVAETISNDDLVLGVTVLGEKGEQIYSNHNLSSDESLLRNHSVNYRNRHVGELQLIFTRAPLAETLSGILLISLLVWLLAVLSIGGLTHLFVRKYFRGPLESFTELAEGYRDNSESPPTTTTPYLEFLPIENVVKNLANEVFVKLIELENHRKYLQAEIAERTQDLQISRDEAEAARARSEIANQAKSTFLANMSHELRTPLNAILGFSEMLGSDSNTSTDQQEKLGIINRSGEHLLKMINDVLDLSKIESGVVELEPELFDLPQTLKDISRMFEELARKSQLHFELEIDEDLPQFINADLGKLRQILINILGNSLKFTRRGSIILRARVLPITNDPALVTLQLEIEDSGPGIPQDKLEHVFEPFAQIDGAISSTKGTGLGLTITQSFVELMGGSIIAESDVGQGSLFRITVAVNLAEGVEVNRLEQAMPKVTGLVDDQPAWRILIVEDNVENRMLLSNLLREVGYDVREAENGEEAVVCFQQWHPHFIWMDIHMPVMDGYQATAKIRTLPGGEDVKIIAITASVFKEQADTILVAGCDDVVRKPYRRSEVLDMMAKQIEVRYQYASEAKEPISMPPLDTERLHQLPESLLSDLRQAALRLSVGEIDKIIDRISDIDQTIANDLRAHAASYQFDQILEMLEPELV